MGRIGIYNGLIYGGGGAIVIPNPEGTPTDELHSIQIDEDIYEIVSSSGASAIEKTQSEYDALTPAEKNNGTIYMVQGEAEIIETPIDMSSITSFIEESSIMSVASTTDTTTVTYRRVGSSVGCTFYYTNKIDLTTVNQVKFGLETGDNYHQADSPQNPIHIGFCSTAPSGFSPTFDIEEEYYLRNHTYTDEDCVIDTSELTGEYYLTVISHGWNLVINDFILEGTGEVLANKIYYMGTEYANTNGGSGDDSQELISYDTTITTTQYGWWEVEDKDGNTLDVDKYELLAVTPTVDNTTWTGAWDGAFYIQEVSGNKSYEVTFVNINDGGYIRTSRTWDVKVVYRDKNAAGGGSGGSSSVDYSTEEREIGTWIDGSPVYQKTIYIGRLTYGSTWINVPHNIDNMGMMVELFGSFLGTGDGRMYPITVTRPTMTNGVCFGVDTTYFWYINNWLQTNATDKASVTIRYTKATT
ncbi:MAG: hypothetical protein J6T10_29385 [Methanobrevibacter sp.]|nr:hypothetical protein [Methanobrevibacter sp.]